MSRQCLPFAAALASILAHVTRAARFPATCLHPHTALPPVACMVLLRFSLSETVALRHYFVSITHVSVPSVSEMPNLRRLPEPCGNVSRRDTILLTPDKTPCSLGYNGASCPYRTAGGSCLKALHMPGAKKSRSAICYTTSTNECHQVYNSLYSIAP